jgi:uncharacterized membrane protein YeaQ/YmgE (transglycosylase-associated protein family)
MRGIVLRPLARALHTIIAMSAKRRLLAPSIAEGVAHATRRGCATRREGGDIVINILVWIIVGGIAGWLAGLVVQGTGLGVIGDIIVGIVGALIGGFIVALIGANGFTGFNIWSLIVAFIGAVILLLILKAIGVGRGRGRAV